MKRLFSAALLVLMCSTGYAQDDSDNLSMNGIAVYEQLRHQYYIGALYLPYPAGSIDDALFMPGKKRMDIRVVTESWSPRRFAQQWNQLILINNPQDSQRTLSKDILAFTSLPKDDLQAGDHLVIDYIPETGTVVSLNGDEMLTANEGLFNLLLNCWLGARPPSSGFKENILNMPSGADSTELLTMFEITAPTNTRRQQTAGWGGASAQIAMASKAAPAPTPVAAPAPEPKPEPKANAAAAQEKARKAKEEAEKARLAAQRAEQEKARKDAIAKALREAKAKAQVKAQAQENRKAMISKYSTDMVRASYRHVRYPKRALKLNQEGTVLLEVVLDRKGDVLSTRVIQSSSYPALDDAAVSAVEKTAPFPEIPNEIDGEKVEFTLPFTFQISS